MSLRKLNSLLVIAALIVVSAVSCKKDEETTVLPYLTGLYFDCPTYVSPGEAVRLIPKGIDEPEDVEVGYCWRVTPTMSQNDTIDAGEIYVHWFSDTLKTYNVNCYAFAKGYNNAYATKEVMVVKGGLDGSITQTGIKPTDPKVTVDGIDYYYVRVGGLDWFRNNLAVTGSGVPYVNSDVMSDVFGRFYSYEEAMTACPEGWRIPTEEDWMSLANSVEADVTEKYTTFDDVASKLFANASFNGVQIIPYWPEVGDITNDGKVGLLPFGYTNLRSIDGDGKYPDASFDGVFEYAVYWTADKVEGNANQAYYRYMISNQPEMFVAKGDVKTFGASVRCVRDAK